MLSIIVLMILVNLFSISEEVAVMSIDLGNEWMKVATVSPGVPMDIVLNKESKRKTPVAVAFRGNERLFGEDALNWGTRYPKQRYFYLLDVLGKKFEHPQVEKYRERFPYYNIYPDPDTGSIIFHHDEEHHYTPEELLAMILIKAQEFAEEHARQKPIKEVVLTVPPYFNQAERRAILRAAKFANLKVLQLLNSNVAVALNYGIFRRQQFNDSLQRTLFFDMGASGTIVTLAGYIHQNKNKSESAPQLSILGVGYDRFLGGLELQIRLRDYLAAEFDHKHGNTRDIYENHRAMAKLLNEAGKLKNVLSANNEHTAHIESLFNDIDFHHIVSRQKLDELCGDLLDNIINPVNVALNHASLTLSDVDQVILMGAATRMPSVQNKLEKFFGKEIKKLINTDEAAALGAAIKAAELGKGFKIKKFLTKDTILFPIVVDFERESELSTHKIVRRTLFGVSNFYPQKKVMTFNKHSNDFVFHVNIGDLQHLPAEDIPFLGSLNLTEVHVIGVTASFENHKKNNSEHKGVKVHFAVDDSGIFTINSIENVFEIEEQEEENKTMPSSSEDESSLSKLSNTISKLFGGSDPETLTDQELHSNKLLSKNVTNLSVNDTNFVQHKTNKKLIRENLEFVYHRMDMKDPSDKLLKLSQEKLHNLELADERKHKREAAFNHLESFIIEAQIHFSQQEYLDASTIEERENILQMCSEFSSWLYEDGINAETEIYEEKLHLLQEASKDVYNRVKEHQRRPEALDALDQVINASQIFLSKITNVSVEEQYFTSVEIATLDKLINDTKVWKKQMIEEQSNSKLYEPVKLTVYHIAEKMAILDREIKYLINKAKITKGQRMRKAAEELLKNATLNLNDTYIDSKDNYTDTLTDKIPVEKQNNSPENNTGSFNINDNISVDSKEPLSSSDGNMITNKSDEHSHTANEHSEL